MVAAGYLDAAMVADLPLDRCEVLLSRCLALGFASLYGRALELMAFCEHCEERGARDRARLYLEPLLEDLEAEVARTGADVWATCLESARDQIRRLDGHAPGT